MTPAPATVDADLLAIDALDRMYIDEVRHLPVVDDTGALVGVLSSRDFAQLVSDELTVDHSKVSVADVMSKNPYSCDVSTPLSEVALNMEARRLGSSLVTEDGALVGIFTTMDALQALRSTLAGESLSPVKSPKHVLSEDEREEMAARSGARRQPGGASRKHKLRWALFSS